MKIGFKLCPTFVPNHKKCKPVFVAGTHIFCGSEQIIVLFLQSVQNSHDFCVIGSLFSIFAQGLKKKTHSKCPVSDTQ